MAFKTVCEHCNTDLRAQERRIGEKVKCPRCGRKTTIATKEWHAEKAELVAAEKRGEILRRRHYFYVLILSIAFWLFITVTVGAFFPVMYASYGVCECKMHRNYFNLSFLIYVAGGIITGLVFSYPLHRFALVAYTSPDDRYARLLTLSTYGKALLGRRGLLFILLIAGLYLLGSFIAHSGFGMYPRERLLREFGVTLIHCAIKRGDAEDIRYEIKKGTDPDTPGRYMDTPLELAIHWSKIEAVKALIEGGASLHRKDSKGYTPLYEAYSPEIARLLIEKGARVNVKGLDGWSPLFYALDEDRFEVAAALVENGANVNETVGPGPVNMILYYFKIDWRVDAIDFLIRNGVNVNTRDIFGQTLLHLAASQDCKHIAALLLDKGADITARDNFGYTPLHFAVTKGGKDVIALLLDRGADVNEKINGRTPMDIADQFHRFEIEGLLRAHGGKTGWQLRWEAEK
ncbi:MAG: hypothetical protein E3J72_10080 [Planctomycetota bacterium]|nr:MAG: hypothetical protein E3J72_10080 [Planctomycetota bacterium]